VSSADSTVPEGGGSRRILSIWVAPIAGLVGLWVWLAFSSGGYIARQWLLPSLALGLFGLVVSLLGAYPRRPRQLSLALLALFGCYSLWVALSALWADSTTRVWMESGRTFSYLLVFGLALVYFTDPAARRWFRYLLMVAAFLLLAVCVWRLWSTDAIVGLFIQNRLAYPVSYSNNAAALFLVAFWPLMWLAAGPEERAPVRGAAIGLATGLLGLAIMTQSRGAIWSLAITVVFMFIVSPARIRLLLYLLVPAALMVYEFPHLNRYWLDGPEVVGGGLGARTLVLASITAAFIGMILSLLERWVKVSRKMKAIFGGIVIIGVVASLVYGSINLTSDFGGPLKWMSQTWRQFTGQTAGPSETSSASRFTIVSSSGRVGIWKVAWQEFESAPVLGVGADNFVFQYNRLRTTETYKPQQAHSIELQVLGDTGLVGGVLVFGGILLALAGLLWPRCTAGWRGARETWLRRRRHVDASIASGASARWCNPRWGTDPRAYGWEMALLAGAGYWLVHASVDWLWQMPGVSIPALLFVAAGVASVDARAELLWPRVNRWLGIRTPAVPTDSLRLEQTEVVAETALPETTTRPTHGERRAMRRERSIERLHPPGLLSHVFRALVVTLSVVVLLVAGLPYLSLQYQNSAKALAYTDGVQAAKRAESAHWLQPADPDPYSTQASIYAGAAWRALESDSPDRAGAVLDNLALAISSLEKAIALEPEDWTLRQGAGVATLNLLLATEYAAGLDPKLDYATVIPAVPGLEDWSALTSVQQEIVDPGAAAGSLAQDETTRAVATRYRSLDRDEVSRAALDFLRAAKARNPLASQISTAIETVEQVTGANGS
jgi:hypothetical protein